MDPGEEIEDLTIDEEIDALKKEYDWLLDFEGKRIFEKVEGVLKECCRRLPLPNKVSPYVTLPAGQSSGLQPEKFMINSTSSDAVRCVITLLGDNVVQADVQLRYAKAPGHMFRSTAHPEVQWKMQQIQDVGNYILKAMETVKAMSQILNSTHRSVITKSGPVDTKIENKKKNRQLHHCISEVIRDLISARSSLMTPKKRSLIELQSYAPNKCFSPPLPNDLLLSFYIVSHKLICAAYVLQDLTPAQQASGKQTFTVMQGECSVQWLNDVLSILHSALLLSQQFKDKVNLFYEIKELREHIHNLPKHLPLKTFPGLVASDEEEVQC